jgi:SAM-dependent MidA family methyltransferase
VEIETRISSVSPPPADDIGEPALVELIRSEISGGGPITFARFMERALYEPGLGYYATSAARPTRAGDFLTAAELHPIFGWTIARQLHEMWQRLDEPTEFVLREYGAGRGTLAAAITDGLTRIESGLARALRYEAVDVQDGAQPGAPTGPFVGCVLGNEFLDALPVHRVVQAADGPREIYVDWATENFVEVAGPPSDPRIAGRLEGGPMLQVGQQAEISLAIPAWLSMVAQELERGYVLLFDYGLPTAELRSPDRPTGTIRAVRGQHVSSDVLSAVGRQDLTAHVDLDALEADAQTAGLIPLGRTSQAEFLMGAGLEDAYAAAREDADKDWQAALDLRAAMRRLLDPQHMGAYAALAFAKGVSVEPPLAGMSFRTPGRP